MATNNNSDLVLSDLTHEFSDYKTQFETYLTNRNAWRGTLTTMTSTTLVDLVSSVGAFIQGRLTRTYEDSFSETAQSDDAIRSITQMQGLRMSRKLPAGVNVTLTSTVDLQLDPMTQFTVAGQYYFNREEVVMQGGVPLNLTLFQGQIVATGVYGVGGPRQTFLSLEDSFAVSDLDVVVRINGTAIPKSLGNLWNYRGLPAYADLTTSDGRLLIVFGSQQFGTTPLVTDEVLITYPLTNGAEGSNQQLIGKQVTATGFSTVSGTAISNPTGGGNEQPINAYKNLASGSFGTYSSAVTKSQYLATVGVYPGLIDAVTQAQRDINPMALEWMNVIRVAALTLSPWTQQQQRDFINYLQTVTMYAGRFVWQEPIAVPRDVDITVYCYNSAELTKVQSDVELAITKLYAPRAGLLLTNFYESDLTDTSKAASKGAQSYAIVASPSAPQIVTGPLSPVLEYQILDNAGTLGPLVYAYAVTAVNNVGEEGAPTNFVFPQVVSVNQIHGIRITWNPLQDTVSYRVYGRSSVGVGLMATIQAGQPLVFLDDGSIVPDQSIKPQGTGLTPIRYNQLRSLKVTCVYAERQQRLNGTPTRLQT